MPDDLMPKNPNPAESNVPLSGEVSDDTRKSKRRFRLLIILAILIYAIIHTYKATIEYQEAKQEDIDVFNESLEEYREQVRLSIDRRHSQVDVDVATLGIKGANGVIMSNFEGPKIGIHAMEFEGDLIDLNDDPGVEDYSVTSMLFDPDHAVLGLPNLDVKVSPIRPFKQETEDSRLQKLLGSAINILPGRRKTEGPRPYKVYKKRVPYDSVLKTVAMQLWLMEFHITASISSDEIKDNVQKKLIKEDEAQQEEKDAFFQLKLDSLLREVDLRRKKRESAATFREKRKKDQEKRAKKRLKNVDDFRKIAEKLIKRPKSKKWLRRKAEMDQIKRQDSISLARDRLDIAQDATQAQKDLENEAADQNLLLTFKRNLRAAPGHTFPPEWYDRVQAQSIKDLKKEDDPNGADYDNLKVWFKVEPNTAPWYVQSNDGKNLQPIMAVGAIYCTEVKNGFERAPEYSIGSNTSKGIAMGLYETPHFKSEQTGKLMDGTQILPSEMEVLDSNPAEGSIWNKPYYIKLFLKNIGVKRGKNKIIGGKKYHDQVTYSFLMPIFVRGSWDVMPPDDVIPDWDPPRPQTGSGVQLKWIVPKWGLPWKLGGIFSTIIMVVGIGFVLMFFFPALGPLFGNIINSILGGINKFFKGFAKALTSKKSS